jgi:BlaI family transcriptional regulator, penicillinase repressor
MPRRPSTGLTPLELEIMQVLWRQGPSAVQQVQEELGRPLAYNTVQTMLNVLLRKGRVRRERQERAYVYAPALTRVQAMRHAVQDLVQRMFEGSPEDLVMSLIETRQLTPERVERLAALVNERKGGRRERS